MSGHHVCAYGQLSSGKDIQSPGTTIIESCELPCRCQRLNMGPLQNQQLLVTCWVEPSFPTPTILFETGSPVEPGAHYFSLTGHWAPGSSLYPTILQPYPCFSWVLGFQIWVPLLSQQAFYWLSHLPSPFLLMSVIPVCISAYTVLYYNCPPKAH